MIADPPFDAGAVHTNEICVLPSVTCTPVGASGTVRGVEADDDDEYVPVPTVFTAATRKTYCVPFVRPVTVYDVVALPTNDAEDQDVPAFDEY